MKILKFRPAEDGGPPSDNANESAQTPGDGHSGENTNEQGRPDVDAKRDDQVENTRTVNTSNQSDDQSEDQSEDVKTPGSRLRAARARRNLTIEQVATELNLSKDTIAALEEEDYDALPEKTYVQGYLKSYARLVDISESDVIGPSVNPSLIEPETKAIKPARVLPEPKRPGSGLGVMLLGLVGLMIAAAVWMGYQQEWFSMSPDTASVEDTVRLGPGTTATDSTITASRTVESIAPGSEQSVTFGKRKPVDVVASQVPAADSMQTTTQSEVVNSVVTQEPDSTTTVSTAVAVTPTVTDVVINTTDSTRPSYNPEVVVIASPSASSVTTPSDAAGGEVVETIIETVTISATGEEITTIEVIAGDGTISSSASSSVETASISESVVETQPVEVVETAAATETTQAEPDASSERVINPAWPELVLTGSGDSWVEIVDATGEKVFVEMVKNKQSYRVQGEPPLSLLIGNAPAVALTFDGDEIDVEGSANSSNVARLTLGE